MRFFIGTDRLTQSRGTHLVAFTAVTDEEVRRRMLKHFFIELI